MKRVILFFFLAALAVAQTPKSVQVCWTPDGGTPTCQTFQPGTVTMVTLDLRQTPAEYVVVQPLPAYQIQAMQTHVTNQTYNVQQANGSLLTMQRYSSIQDLLVQYMIRAVVVPCLQLYPPTGTDTGKTTTSAAMADILAGIKVTLIQ
jgi:hypothetical protein